MPPVSTHRRAPQRALAALFALATLLSVWGIYTDAHADIRLVPQLAYGGGGARISRDGRYSVRWLGADDLTLWDHHSGLFLGTIEPPPRVANRCAIAPGGRYLAYEAGKNITVQDLDGGAVRQIGPHPHVVTGVFFSQDGSRLFVAHAKNGNNSNASQQALTAWAFPEGKKKWQIATPVGGGGILGHGNFAPGSKPDQLYQLAAGGVIRRIESGREVGTVPLPPGLPRINALAISKDGKRAASVTWSRTKEKSGAPMMVQLTYWDWSATKPVKTVNVGQPRRLSMWGMRDEVAISPDGELVLALGLATAKAPKLHAAGYRFLADAPSYIVEEPGDILAFSADSKRAIVGTSVRFANDGKPALPLVPNKSEWDLKVGVHEDTAFVAQGRDLTVWSLSELRLVSHLPNELPTTAQSLEVAPDGQHLLIRTKKGYELFDVKTRKSTTLPRIEGFDDPRARFAGADQLDLTDLQVISFAGDGRPGRYSLRAAKWSISRNKLIGTIRRLAERPAFSARQVSPDGRWAAVIRNQKPTVELRHADSGKLERRWRLAGKDSLPRMHWTTHGLVTVTENIVQLWLPGQDEPLATHELGGRTAFLHANVSTDGGKVAIAGAGQLLVVDAATGNKLIQHSLAKIGYAGNVALGKRWALVTAGATPSVLRLTSGRSARLVSRGPEWVIAAPDGTFTASAGGGRLLAAAQGRRGFFVDQLALTFNDPAKLLSELGTGSKAQREHYSARRKRRLRRAGLKSDAATRDLFATAPEVRFLKSRVEGKHVAIELEASSGRGLLSYNIDVDGVPVHGREGRALSGKKQRIEERVELGRGANRVELRVVDQAGVESLRPFRVFNFAGKVQQRLYFVGFGVSTYANPKFNLTYAHKDVLDMAAALQHGTKGIGHFSEVNTLALVNEQVTPAAIKKARGFLESAGVDDTVVLMVAGHGVHSRDAAARYYFVTHNTELDRLAETAAPFEDIEALLHGIAPRKKLLLMDTCESGERDPEEETKAVSSAGSRGLKARTTRALVLENQRAAPVRRFVLERDRFIFQDVLRRSGAVVLSSSRGSELSYETDDVHNGVFTEAVLQALTSSVADKNGDGLVSHQELRSSVLRSVARMTQDAQHPTVDRDNTAISFSLPVMPSAAKIASRETAPLPKSPEQRSAASPPPAPPAESPGARGCGCALPGGRNQSSDQGWFLLALACSIAGGLGRKRSRAVCPERR